MHSTADGLVRRNQGLERVLALLCACAGACASMEESPSRSYARGCSQTHLCEKPLMIVRIGPRQRHVARPRRMPLCEKPT